MGDVTSTCCQNTTHMQEMNLTRQINTVSQHQPSVQNYTYEPFQQPSTQIKNTFKQAAKSTYFKYNNPSLSFQTHSEIWNEKNVISIVKKIRLNNNQSQKSSIFDIISSSDSNKICTYAKSLMSNNVVFQQQQTQRPQENQPLVYNEHTYKVFNGLFLIHFPGKQYFLGHLDKNSPTNGIFVFKNGCYYVGDIKDLTAQGEGKYENKQNGYLYEGLWSKNLQHGKGKQFYERNGDKFQGQFMYGSKFGQGKYEFNDGRIYEGYFYNGLSDGKGRLTVHPKEWYNGEWKLGSIQGSGQYHYSNGDIYFGQFENGLKSGNGRYVFSAGYEYDGQWLQGKMHGFGIIRQGYDQIEGQWIQGKKVA